MATKKKTNTKSKSKASKAEPKDKKIETKAKAEAKPEDAAETKAARRPKGAAPAKRHPLTPKTFFPKPGQFSERWKLVDASNLPLGRLSSEVAKILMGKDTPNYTPFTDTGAHVVVVNAEKVTLTGNKWNDKVYQYHTNYPGGLKTISAQRMRETHPDRLIELAVYRMLPKSKGHMARRWFKKLRVYSGTDHPHKAQNPEVVQFPHLAREAR